MRYIFIGSIVVILIATFFSFIPVLNNGFVNWDDDILLTRNPDIRQISLSRLKNIFSSFYGGTYIPLTILSFSVEYRFFGKDPKIYHLTNLLLHILNCLSVFLLVFFLTKNITIAFITALLFGIHPLRVESVAWVTERKDVLYAFFFFTSLLLYLHYIDSKRLCCYIFSIILFLFSFLAKGMAMTLPFVLLLIDWFRARKFERSVLLEKIPFFVIAIISAVFAILAQQTLKGHTFSFFKNIIISSYTLVFYLSRIILPVGLAPFYPFPLNIADKPPLVFFLAPFIFILFLGLIIMSRRRTNKILFGGLFFIITILPVAQIIPVAGPEITANRYTYIPSVGILFILAYIFFVLMKNRNLRVIAILGLIVIAGFYSSQTFKRCRFWKDSITLWNEVLKRYPESPHAYNQRGLAYLERGSYTRAIGDFSRAIAINPDFAGSYNNRGIAYRAAGRYGQAYNDFSEAIFIDSSFVDAFYNRGNLLMKVGEFSRAIDDYSYVLKIRPDYLEAYINRGNAYGREGEYQRAIEDYNRVLEIEPDNSRALYNRAVAYYGLGRYKDALNDIRRLKNLGYPVEPDIIDILKKNIQGSIK